MRRSSATPAGTVRRMTIDSRILGANLVWFYVHAPLAVCIERDPKGIYQRAKAGQIKQLIEYPFEAPRPEECGNRSRGTYGSGLKVRLRRVVQGIEVVRADEGDILRGALEARGIALYELRRIT